MKIARYLLFLGRVLGTYDILSIDSAQYKGYLSVHFVQQIEKHAYQVAKSEFCIADRPS